LGTIIRGVKEIVDGTFIGVGGAITTSQTLAVAVNNYTGGVGDCPIGCKLFGMDLFLQCSPDSVTQGLTDMYVAKIPGGITTSSMPIPGATGGNENRKYILHEQKGIPGGQVAGALPTQWHMRVRIPKGRQRMAENDKVIVRFRNTNTYNACVKAVFKWYT